MWVIWLREDWLKDIFPKLFRLAFNKNATIADLWQGEGAEAIRYCNEGSSEIGSWRMWPNLWILFILQEYKKERTLYFGRRIRGAVLAQSCSTTHYVLKLK